MTDPYAALVAADERRRASLTEALAGAARIVQTVAHIAELDWARPNGVIVVDHDLDEDAAAVHDTRWLAQRHRVVATSARLLRTDLWLVRSCGVAGFAAGFADLPAAVHAAASGEEYWPFDLGPAPEWVQQPLSDRICSFLRSRERARFGRLIHDNALQTIEGLAMVPDTDPAVRLLLVAEGARLRSLVESCRTDRPADPVRWPVPQSQDRILVPNAP